MASWSPQTYAGVPDSPLEPRNVLDTLLREAEDVQQYDHDEIPPGNEDS
jgi:hypothetical protein